MTQSLNVIFLVDDDPDDQFLFEEALQEANPSITFKSAKDGIDALDQLLTGQVEPDLIFMDVNMPRMNGIDCLQAIKDKPQISQIPVYMYSTSTQYEKECRALGASDYIEKPDDFKKLCELLKGITANTGSHKNA